jgi:hypothetical protein
MRMGSLNNLGRMLGRSSELSRATVEVIIAADQRSSLCLSLTRDCNRLSHSSLCPFGSGLDSARACAARASHGASIPCATKQHTWQSPRCALALSHARNESVTRSVSASPSKSRLHRERASHGRRCIAPLEASWEACGAASLLLWTDASPATEKFALPRPFRIAGDHHLALW